MHKNPLQNTGKCIKERFPRLQRESDRFMSAPPPPPPPPKFLGPYAYDKQVCLSILWFNLYLGIILLFYWLYQMAVIADASNGITKIFLTLWYCSKIIQKRIESLKESKYN